VLLRWCHRNSQICISLANNEFSAAGAPVLTNLPFQYAAGKLQEPSKVDLTSIKYLDASNLHQQTSKANLQHIALIAKEKSEVALKKVITAESAPRPYDSVFLPGVT
jgi:hypothetical protein